MEACILSATRLHWREVRRLAIKTGDQFRSEPPPGLDSRRYHTDLDEVKTVGAAHSTERPQDRTDVAQFSAAVLATPLWNGVAAPISAGQGRSLSENARALALVNIAISDAVVAVLETKYHYTFWRPETAIRAGHTASGRKRNLDPEFAPLVPTPCHPGFPSGHASASYAAREVLDRTYGDHGHEISLSVETVPNVKLHYTSLAEITRDIDDARVYGGIHFRFDQQAGARQGPGRGVRLPPHSSPCARYRQQQRHGRSLSGSSR